MELFLECGRVVLFCAALLLFLLQFAKNKAQVTRAQQGTVIAIGIGFVFGTVLKLLRGASPAMVLLYLMAAMLAFATFLFSLPDQVVEKM